MAGRWKLAAGFALAGCGVAIAAPGPLARRLNAGLWESVTTMNGRAMPPGRTCVSARDAADINGDDAAVRAGLARTNGKDGCRVANVKIAGSSVAFDSLCGGTTAQTTITYRGDSYGGAIVMMAGGKQVGPVMTLTARRIGACPAGGVR